MDKNTRDIFDSLDFIKNYMMSEFDAIKGRMATKADIAELRLELNAFKTETERSFRALNLEIKTINRRLDHLEQSFGNLKGVTKEIDDLRERVRDIEKHLGLSKKIAA